MLDSLVNSVVKYTLHQGRLALECAEPKECMSARTLRGGRLVAEQHEREWVRNHTIAGYVVGRFQGEHEGTWRDLVAVQTWDGARVVPEAALIPIDKDYMIRQAGLDLERVIQGIIEGGLDLD